MRVMPRTETDKQLDRDSAALNQFLSVFRGASAVRDAVEIARTARTRTDALEREQESIRGEIRAMQDTKARLEMETVEVRSALAGVKADVEKEQAALALTQNSIRAERRQADEQATIDRKAHADSLKEMERERAAKAGELDAARKATADFHAGLGQLSAR